MPYQGYTDYFDKPMILSVATTGGMHGKEANENLPEQPEEIVDDVVACREAGATIVHIHARDENGDPTKDPAKFQEIRDLIDERAPDMLVNFTTGGGTSPEDRIAPVKGTDPAPDLATIDLIQSLPRDQHIEFGEIMDDLGVKPEIELFNDGQFNKMDELIEEDLLEEPYWCTVIFGMDISTKPHPRNVLNLVDNLPEGTEWQAMGIGRHQLPLTTLAITLGGHVRVGMEDNVYYRYGELAESNAQLVKRTAEIAEQLERPIATPEETRELLGL